MWMTAQGETVLRGTHATLIRHALGFVADIVEQRADQVTTHWQFNVPPFDKLEWRPQLVLLSRVGDALLSDQVATPQHTELHDATAAVLYAAIRQSIEIEIDTAELFAGDEDWETDDPALPSWREMVLAACYEEEIDDLPPVDSPDFDEWDVLIDCLSTNILWDADWQIGDLFLDVDPQRGNEVKRTLGIDHDYFVDVPPEGDEDELMLARSLLQRILAPPQADDDLI
jgi:hypothetical protein